MTVLKDEMITSDLKYFLKYSYNNTANIILIKTICISYYTKDFFSYIKESIVCYYKTEEKHSKDAYYYG